MQPVLLAVVVGSAFLLMFYRAVRLRWPESYFGASDLAAYSISQSPIRYLAFRFGPPYLVSVFVWVSLDRASANGTAGVVGLAAVHCVARPGWALVQATRWPKAVWRHRVPILMLHLVVLAGLGVVAWLAVLSADSAAPVVPSVAELSATLWTGLAAGVVGAFVVQVARGAPIGEQELIERGIGQVPRHLWDLARRVSDANDADPRLVHAVMVVECLQRPSWFRRLEYIKAKLHRPGSYGIMQVQASEPVSDEESIERVVTERFAHVPPPISESGCVDSGAVEDFARLYNPNPNFVSLLETAYTELFSREEYERELEPPPL